MTASADDPPDVYYFLTISGAIALFLTVSGFMMKRFAENNPSHWLARPSSAGTGAYAYVIQIVGQAFLIPYMFVILMESEPLLGEAWWTDKQTGKFTLFYAYLLAYFIADVAVNYRSLGPLLCLHHVNGVASCLVAEFLPGVWRGLFLTLALSFELGSCARGFRHFVPAHWPLVPSLLDAIFMLSSAIPLMWVARGVMERPPQFLWGWYLVTGAMIGGLLRIRDSWQERQRALQNGVKTA